MNERMEKLNTLSFILVSPWWFFALFQRNGLINGRLSQIDYLTWKMNASVFLCLCVFMCVFVCSLCACFFVCMCVCKMNLSVFSACVCVSESVHVCVFVWVFVCVYHMCVWIMSTSVFVCHYMCACVSVCLFGRLFVFVYEMDV